ncbi:MAG: 2-oxo acid dehydrogenase subunit E2 [Kiritimatiellae bacterium]|nr:2-oxo acid dehydrogenase subunit E2 [Kiritimatiellia bacterium]
MVEFRLPDLGEGIDSADVVRVLVTPGTTVTKDQPLLELETGKATVEVPSPADGTVTQVHVKDGDKVTLGQLLVTLDAEGAAAGATAPSPPSESKQEEQLPPPAPPAPATSSAPSTLHSGASLRAEPGAGQTRGTRQSALPIPAAPSVRLFASEIGIDISAVPGSGPKGRISIDDVKQYAKALNTGRSPGGAGAPVPPLPDFSKWGAVEREAASTIRRRTAEHMSASWLTVPHVTQFDEADMTSLDERRRKLAQRAEKTGGKLTITPILVKIVVSALKMFPKFNAALDVTRGEVIYRQYFHVGVAVDTPRGLLVPVVRDADKKNIVEIAAELAALAQRARDGKLAPDEMTGGCFTVTNLGAIGGTHFTPIINYPEAAILGVGRARMTPCFSKDICQPRLILPLSLSYDHRLIDGADGARFLRWIAEAAEEPLLIPLEG